MTLKTAYDAVKARMDAQWPTIETAVPVAYQNTAFAGMRDANGDPQAWLFLELRWSGGEAITIGAPGNNLVRREGNIWLHAFIPSGTDGPGRAMEIASEAATVFEEQDFGGLVCAGAEPGGEADSEDGSFYGQSVAVPFIFDEAA